MHEYVLVHTEIDKKDKQIEHMVLHPPVFKSKRKYNKLLLQTLRLLYFLKYLLWILFLFELDSTVLSAEFEGVDGTRVFACSSPENEHQLVRADFAEVQVTEERHQ